MEERNRDGPTTMDEEKGTEAEVEWNVLGWRRSFDQCSWRERLRYEKAQARFSGADKSRRIHVDFISRGRIGKLFTLYGNVDSSKADKQMARVFRDKLLEECSRQGIKINKVHSPQGVDLNKEVAFTEHVFKTIALETLHDKEPPLILYFDPMTKGAHDQLKFLESLLQLRTQHVNYEVIDRAICGDYRIVTNIVRQINMKIGGVNYDVRPTRLPKDATRWFKEDATLVFGYCVAHPILSADSDSDVDAGLARKFLSDSPSIVGFSANCSATPGAYVSDFHFQKRNEEMVSSAVLTQRMEWVLNLFVINKNRLPQKILLIRDGLRECLFDRLLSEELSAIKKACNAFRKDYNPKFVVVAINHEGMDYYDFNVLEDDGGSVTADMIGEFLAWPFTHQLADYNIYVPLPLYEAFEWTKRGAKIFSGYRSGGRELPRIREEVSRVVGSDGRCIKTVRVTVDWEAVTSLLCYKNKRLEGLRVKA